MLCDISRGDVLLLMGRMCMPEFMKEKFAVVGIMQSIMPFSDDSNDEKIIYRINDSAFADVPDIVLGSMYADLKKFCTWYWQKKAYLEEIKRRCSERTESVTTGTMSLKWLYPLCKFSPSHPMQEHDMEVIAVHFMNAFIAQWRKYMICGEI